MQFHDVHWQWPNKAMLAGALCLALGTAPALAQPQDDNEDSAPLPRKEIRVYRHDDGDPQSQGGYLGVRVQEVTKELQKARDLPSTNGALINTVEPGSPADRAGLRRWDLIVEFNRDRVDDPSDLIHTVRGLDAGEKATVVVFREGQRRTFQVTLGNRPKGEDIPGMGPMPGLEGMGRMRRNDQEIQERLDRIERELTQLREQDLERLERAIRDLQAQLREKNGQDRSRNEDRDSD
jgi:hypothetical protein